MNDTGPSPATTYERARRLANIAVWTARLQRRRLATRESEDEEFLLRRWADFQFFIAALLGIRRAATLAAKVPVIANNMQKTIRQFDATLPMLKNMRDVSEHFDDYALDKGRAKGIKRGVLEVGSFSDTALQ
jgi:hypothetical protein